MLLLPLALSLLTLHAVWVKFWGYKQQPEPVKPRVCWCMLPASAEHVLPSVLPRLPAVCLQLLPRPEPRAGLGGILGNGCLAGFRFYGLITSKQQPRRISPCRGLSFLRYRILPLTVFPSAFAFLENTLHPRCLEALWLCLPRGAPEEAGSSLPSAQASVPLSSRWDSACSTKGREAPAARRGRC